MRINRSFIRARRTKGRTHGTPPATRAQQRHHVGPPPQAAHAQEPKCRRSKAAEEPVARAPPPLASIKTSRRPAPAPGAPGRLGDEARAVGKENALLRTDAEKKAATIATLRAELAAARRAAVAAAATAPAAAAAAAAAVRRRRSRP